MMVSWVGRTPIPSSDATVRTTSKTWRARGSTPSNRSVANHADLFPSQPRSGTPLGWGVGWSDDPAEMTGGRMAERRTKVYLGRQEQQRDEADAIAHGWRVVSRDSRREGYRVTYEYGPGWASATGP